MEDFKVFWSWSGIASDVFQESEGIDSGKGNFNIVVFHL